MKRSIIIMFLVLTGLFCENNFSQQKEDIQIALIYPQLTKEILYKNVDSFNPTESWELFFLSNGFNYEMLNDEDLGNINSGIKVVIIPSLEVVDKDIIENIEGLLKDGKGILFTGNVAEYDGDGNRTSNDYQKRIMGFDISRLEDENELSLNLCLGGNTPLSIGLKPGQKILLKRKPALYYSSNLSPGCILSGKYLQADGELSGMILNTSSDKRVLWYGFNFDQLIGNDRKQLVKNSVEWLSSAPEIFMNYWPAGYLSAALIYKNINRPYDFTGDTLPGLGSAKINYFIAPEILEDSDFYLNELKHPGNINILWDDFFFSGMSESKKSDWLKRTVPLIRKYTEQKYSGVYSYGEFYDSTTYDLMKREGYKFIFSSGYSNSFSYSYDSTDNIYFFELTKSPGMGYNSRINYILNQGGIGYVNEDSLSGDDISLLSNTSCWLTTFSGLLEWVENSRCLDLAINSEKKSHFNIDMRNNSSSIIRDVGIWISIPGSNGNLTLENAPESGEMTYNFEKKMYYLRISSISGYQTISCKISDQM